MPPQFVMELLIIKASYVFSNRGEIQLQTVVQKFTQQLIGLNGILLDGLSVICLIATNSPKRTLLLLPHQKQSHAPQKKELTPWRTAFPRAPA